MTLHDYLQSEQAREDVRALLADYPAREVRLSNGGTWHKPAGKASRAIEGLGVDTNLSLRREQAWHCVGMAQRDNELLGAMMPILTAYYRPDGDRFTVTDLGEGVRALRLRTGFLHSVAVEAARVSRIGLEGPGEWRMGGDADIEIYGVTSANLPDAICRVMLASLKVSEAAS
jgi:hypothetical protein